MDSSSDISLTDSSEEEEVRHIGPYTIKRNPFKNGEISSDSSSESSSESSSFDSEADISKMTDVEKSNYMVKQQKHNNRMIKSIFRKYNDVIDYYAIEVKRLKNRIKTLEKELEKYEHVDVKKKDVELKKDEEYDDATLMWHDIEFKDKEIAKKLTDEEFKEWGGYYETFDNIIKVIDEDGEIDKAKFQEVANKYKIEFVVNYEPESKDKDGFKKEFKPK